MLVPSTFDRLGVIMALRKVRNNIDRLFDKSLTDLIRGIRNNKDNEARYIATCIEEIKMELRQDSIFVKTNAVEKLAYLQMMGYEISWASFNIIEVMASTKFTEKRIGYMAASQCFHDGTDVLMLTTNLIRKDLHSANTYETGVALGAFSCFVTTDLARDLTNDVVNLLSSSRPYIRKRCVLLLYKIFLKYPESLRPTFSRLKEKLEDVDPGVQSAAVNVICELARKNPKNYLTLAPIFFRLMTSSSNNWMLIKIIKLFGALVPLEPRLGKKLLEPLTNLISSTSAMSLLYECINTVIAVLICVSSGAPGDHTASIQLCVQKLGILIEDSDQNLKYLGLLAMVKILHTYPKAVQAHKDIVLRCLDDRDESIRLRALDLLYGMVSKKNIMEIVRKLMEHVDAAEGSFYRDEVLSRIISICSYNNYQYITNFEWYISVLVELTKVEGTKHGSMIAGQMQDVTVRVESIRHFSVSQMALLVENAHLLLAGSAQHRNNMCEVLLAAAWICGEYAEHLRNVQGLLEAVLKVKHSVTPGHILSVYVQNIAKLYSLLLLRMEAEEDWDSVDSLDNLMLSKLPEFESTDHLEAQERACSLVALIRVTESFHTRREKIGEDFAKLFEGELNPVALKAQRKVPIPDGLNLDAWINEIEDEELSVPDYESNSERIDENFMDASNFDRANRQSFEKSADNEQSEEPIQEQAKNRRRAEIQNNPYYVKGEMKSTGLQKRHTKCVIRDSVDKTQLPVELQSPLEIPGVVGLSRYMEQQQSTLSWKAAKKEKKKRSSRNKKASSSEEDDLPIVHQVNRADGEMPENAKSTDDENDVKRDTLNDVYKALDVDLEEPVKVVEKIAVTRPTEIRPQLLPVNEENIRRKQFKDGNPNQETQNGEVQEIRTTKIAKKKSHERKADKMRKKKKTPVSKTDEDITKSSTLEISNAQAWFNTSEAAEVAAKPLSTDQTRNHRSRKKQQKRTKELIEPIDRDVYEVTSGVCTPSNPNLTLSSFANGGLSASFLGGSSAEGAADEALLQSKSSLANSAKKKQFSSYKLLGENNILKMLYETRVSTDDANQVAVCVVFKNKSDLKIKQIELNVLDTINTRLIRDERRSSSEAVSLPFQLPPGVSTEHVFHFSINAINLAQRLRGAVTFFVEDDDGVLEDKIDFQIRLSTVSFVIPATIGSDAYELLISSEDVGFKSSVCFATSLTFHEIIRKIVFFGHFSVVEELKSTALLYAHTIKAEPICILLKLQGEKVQVDGRSNDQQLIYSIVDELREIIST